jgi:hypothetical protein
MQIKFYSTFILLLVFIFALLQNDCNQNKSGSTGSQPSKSSSTRNNYSSSGNNPLKGVSAVGRLKIGGLYAGISIDSKGKTSFVTGFSPVISFGLGPLVFEAAVNKTIPLTEEKPYQLFIIVEDDHGELNRYQYDIGKEFQFEAEWVERVTVVSKNDCMIIVIKNPRSHSFDKTTGNRIDSETDAKYIVDTRNNSGLHLREEKSIASESVQYIPENEAVTFLGCEDEKTYVNSTDRRSGRWCRASYKGVEGWAWSGYLKKVSE